MAFHLATASPLGLRTPALGAGVRAPRRHSILVPRAGDGESKVVREYREDDGKISRPEQGKDEPLYADQIPKKKEARLSPEMEAKLRKEYVGFGGSPNQAMNGNPFLYIILIVSGLAVASWLIGAI